MPHLGTDQVNFVLKVKTDDKNLLENQAALAVYVVQRFDSEGRPLIMARQLSPGKVNENSADAKCSLRSMVWSSQQSRFS